MDDQQQETFDPFPRPGDADFTSFPKAQADDACSYQVYAVPHSLAALQAILRKAKDLERQLLGLDYIWHRDGFGLALDEYSLSASSDSALVVLKSPQPEPTAAKTFLRLAGRTSYGDSIADEWAIAYLLRELTRACPDAWVRIEDGDGEFLLVEAAHALPDWLEPDVAINRVWINQGKLLIIPPHLDQLENGNAQGRKGTSKKAKSSMNVETLDLPQALDYVSRNGDGKFDAMYSESIENEAFYKLRHYPQPAICETFHTARHLLPRRLATIINSHPKHVSDAVHAYLVRDDETWQQLTNTSARQLRFPAGDLVEMSVRMTRVGFAQLRNQEATVLPAYHGSKLDKEDQNASRVSGLKLTVGFEMLLTSPDYQDRRSVQEIALLLEDIEAGDEPLASDVDIQQWPDIQEDDSWLDVDYADFEAELTARRSQGENAEKDKAVAAEAEDTKKGKFGDAAAQENLRRIVDGLEKLLDDDDNDDNDNDDDDDGDDDASETDDATDDQCGDADGKNGIEPKIDNQFTHPKLQHVEKGRAHVYGQHIDYGEDDDSDDDDDWDLMDGEDVQGSFNEAEFEQMMREMMGFPAESAAGADAAATTAGPSTKQAQKATSSTDSKREPTIRERIAAMDFDDTKTGNQNIALQTAQAFQHWAAEADADFADAADRASYLRKQGLPETLDASSQQPQQKADVVDDGFVSLSAGQTGSSSNSQQAKGKAKSGMKPQPGAASTRRTRRTSALSNSLQSSAQRITELDSSSDEDDDHDDDGHNRTSAYAATVAAIEAELAAKGGVAASASQNRAAAREQLARNLLAALGSSAAAAAAGDARQQQQQRHVTSDPAAALVAALGLGRFPGDADGDASSVDSD